MTLYKKLANIIWYYEIIWIILGLISLILTGIYLFINPFISLGFQLLTLLFLFFFMIAGSNDRRPYPEEV
ncbi:MAG: hypothetical protein ACFFG0_12300 [Candidatus Thorarchaeota archaeon]